MNATVATAKTPLSRLALHSTATCSVQASAYGKCILATYTDVTKDVCKDEFVKFAKCLREAEMLTRLSKMRKVIRQCLLPSTRRLPRLPRKQPTGWGTAGRIDFLVTNLSPSLLYPTDRAAFVLVVIVLGPLPDFYICTTELGHSLWHRRPPALN
ncbi:hypothetical protein C8F04DRAFT_1261291 [Mycena alexandri]|uniref:Uncharacterized protein n=1 Tax=Mycena alexandri TaxID=1745969 RepID=A0AAD6X2E6_9AGAR|nr:hypothetical protein C8F04DRAFT_1261291 [Mycena alexandri]